MSELIFYVMDEKVKRRMTTLGKIILISNLLILIFVLGLLIYLKAIYI